jgi:dTDP-glucose 4,6-dehydratase
MPMDYYLVTGGAGFIGANFVKYILEKYKDITVVILDALTYAGNLKTLEEELKDPRCFFVKGNICDSSVLNEIFREYPINFVVNFAAESHVDRSIEDPQLFLTTNILGTQSLLEAVKKYWNIGNDNNGYPIYRKEVKYLQVSTDEVYGSLGETGFFTEETAINPRSPYSASKAGADLIVQAYSETYKLPVNITRCSNNYGPYHFPEKLIPLLIKNILEGRKLPVYGDGSNVRDWLYVEDHCKALDVVLHNAKPGEIYNVGGKNEKQNIEIVHLIIQTVRDFMEKEPVFTSKLKEGMTVDLINENLISFVKDRLGHDQRYAIDPTKIMNELGWIPETKFEEGIVKTVRWFLENQEWIEEVASGDYQKYYEKMYKHE